VVASLNEAVVATNPGCYVLGLDPVSAHEICTTADRIFGQTPGRNQLFYTGCRVFFPVTSLIG
jgi:hypothetical protein